jgi:hypothetical protein
MASATKTQSIDSLCGLLRKAAVTTPPEEQGEKGQKEAVRRDVYVCVHDSAEKVHGSGRGSPFSRRILVESISCVKYNPDITILKWEPSHGMLTIKYKLSATKESEVPAKQHLLLGRVYTVVFKKVLNMLLTTPLK